MTIPIGKMDGDDKEPSIIFNAKERHEILKAEEALGILIPIAKAYYRLLAAAEPEMGDEAAFTHFFQTADCARQIAERRCRVGPVDVDAIAVEIDIPAIADTLPLLLEGFERCRSLWEWEDNLTSTLVLLSRIASKMYTGIERQDLILVGGYGNIFASNP